MPVIASAHGSTVDLGDQTRSGLSHASEQFGLHHTCDRVTKLDIRGEQGDSTIECQLSEDGVIHA